MIRKILTILLLATLTILYGHYKYYKNGGLRRDIIDNLQETLRE